MARTINIGFRILFLFLAVFTVLVSNAQRIKRVTPGVHFRNGLLKTRRNIADGSFLRDSLRTAHFQGHYYGLMQFDRLPDSSLRAEMARDGFRLYDYIADGSYLVQLRDSFSTAELKRYSVGGVFRLPPSMKISQRLRENEAELRHPDRLVAVAWYGDVNEEQLRRGVLATGAVIEPTRIQAPRMLFVRAPNPLILDRLAALPFVSSLAIQPTKPIPLNYNNRAAHGADALASPVERRLLGDGVVVGVGDDSDPSTHIDFAGRLIQRNPEPAGYHATHVTGTVGGGGIRTPTYQGMAPHATLISQFYDDILHNSQSYVSDYDMVLTNNSYTFYPGGCGYNGEYDGLAYYTDVLSLIYPQLLHTFAAGNDGGYTCTPYLNQYATVKSGYQSGKNILTVGNLDDYNNYLIDANSSCGPTLDGRIKPEVTAGGDAISSTTPNNGYGQDWGTSMASPTVTGTLALVEQRYRQLHGGDAPAILLKALACNTATDLGNPGPDFKYGFGRLNGLAAVKSLEADQFAFGSLANGGNATGNITVPAGMAQLKVMLYWADYPAAPFSASTLVNNLDLTVTEPSSTIHHPLILNPDPAHAGDAAVEGVDNLNNIEQVVVNNPTAGSFQVNISGTSVPEGPQPYVLVYQLVPASIVVQYPYGGETLIPKTDQYVRWEANDGSSNPFTLDYSSDNGTTWTTYSSTIPGDARMCYWATPPVASNQCLVRITRNGTGASGMSSHPFTILLPANILSITNPCQGYVQLSWTTNPTVTSYDIMQLKGDTMSVIGNTTSTSYLIGNLNRDSTYWFGVRAMLGTNPGLRSASFPITPSGGACALSALDNDYTVDSLIGLSTGRMYTSTKLSNATPIRVELKNLGTVPSGTPFTMSYSINGAAPVNETNSATIAAGAAANYTFTQTADFSAPGTYTLQVWASYPGDPQLGNDTLTTVIRQLANDPLTLNNHFTEDFESAAAAAYPSPARGFTGLDRADFYASNANGRARTFVNTGMAHSGNRSVTLDQIRNTGVSTSDSLITTFNLSNYSTSDQLWLDFYYRNQGNDSVRGANKVWIRGNDQSAWIPVYILDTLGANMGVYQRSAAIDITGTLTNAVPAQSVSSSFQVKFGEQGYTSANSVVADGSLDDGYIFDDITLTRAANDIGMRSLVSPDPVSTCSASAASVISVRVRNYSNAPISNIPVTYSVNGVTVTETIPAINANDSIVYSFTQTVDLSAYRGYTITAWVHSAGDNYSNNDTLPAIILHTTPMITAYPYLEGFENSDGGWYSGGIRSSWQWGAPAKQTIDKAANGSKGWFTSLAGNYNDNEQSYLYSPCFDLSGLSRPVLSFSHIFQTEDDCDCDFHWAEYSDDGVTWTRLGATGSGTNWYDNPMFNAWQMSYTKWHVSSYDIPSHGARVRFRIVMSSDPGVDYEGIGIDDVHVFDKATVYTAPADSLTLPVSGNSWVNFDIGGGRVAAIHPHGQDLGATTVKVFLNNTGAVRHDTSQYYLDRNIVIQPSTPPDSAVDVRLYFTDSEAVRLMNATGCSACTTIADAYQSGVTQFSGLVAAQEDSSLVNDSLGVTQFHAPHAGVSIIPNDNGYYAEYPVTGFSEFWINPIAPADSAYIPGISLSFTAENANGNGLLQWSTGEAYGLSRFVIEKSDDSVHFTALDSIAAAANGGGVHSYTYTDVPLDTGMNYYRLRLVQQNGSYVYSPVRSVQGPSGGVSIWPNPVHRALIHVNTSTNTRRVRLVDISGKVILSQELRGTLNTLHIGEVATGIYFLWVEMDSGTTVQKILIK
ncbi:MAG TPA: S8 family serine peptidase [Puia sp.]|uniref:S8 family serine peptidase n=1 Tax=Puia sp. TaxID=2045100 RepID=UPI002C8EFE5D|nr:S8 family serine peptidase [Puia sp.]HVU96576.1 S8 family serine peptidase [Puia sp.]